MASNYDFERTMLDYLQITKKTEQDALNAKAADIAYWAASFTPVATAASITASLKKDPHLLAALTSLHLAGRKLSAPEFKKAMADLLKSRQGAKKYLRSGWAPIIRALGRSFRGGTNAKAENAYSKSSGIHSGATKATFANLTAVLTWITDQPNAKKAAGAEAIAEKALDQAIEFVVDDMEEYITDRLANAYQ